MRARTAWTIALLAASGLACESPSLHGADGAIPPGADLAPGPDGGGPTTGNDGSPGSVLVTGVHAFDAVSSLTGGRVVHDTWAGWTSPVPLTVPSSQSVTLVLDADAGRLLVEDAYYPISPSGPRTFVMKGEFTLWRATDQSWVTYENVTLTIDGERLTGTANVHTMDITLAGVTDVDLGTATLTGGPDVTAPALAVVPWDPVERPFQAVSVSPYAPAFTSLRISAGEPLPPPDVLQLRSDSGDLLTLASTFLADATVHHDMAPTSGPAATSFFTPWVVLRFADHYRLVVDGVTDFAGNPAVGIAFDTPPRPALVPEDGFESASVADGLAGAQIIDGTGLPVISGGKSLYGANAALDPQKCFLGQVHGTSLLLRLAVPPGATVARFWYREVGAAKRGSAWHTALVGFEGGAINRQTVYDDSTTLDTQVALPDGTTAFLGPILPAEVDLPPGAGTEVIFSINDFIAGCEDRDPTGLIIDDLRVE